MRLKLERIVTQKNKHRNIFLFFIIYIQVVKLNFIIRILFGFIYSLNAQTSK